MSPGFAAARVARCFAGLFSILVSLLTLQALEPVPEKLVVLTFDDSVKSHYTVVRPLLKEFGFGATFFITEGFSFRTNKQDYMTWEEIAGLHRDGFEIGNHTVGHISITRETLGIFKKQLDGIRDRCVEHGIPAPTSFAWPGNALTLEALPILRDAGITLARRGGSPEHPYEWGRGFAYEPGKDHPLLIPSAGDARPDWTLDDFKRAVNQAGQGRIAVIQFHGVPDRDHPWVHTDPGMFRQYLNYLKEQKFRVVALRDLARHVDTSNWPASPNDIMELRKMERKDRLVEGRIMDARTGKLIPGRLYIRSASGDWFFAKSSSFAGPAIRYDRRSGSYTNSVERHTALQAFPWRVELPPGQYDVWAECGKEYLVESLRIGVGNSGMSIELPMRRWINMEAEGWFSGDTHNHRSVSEIGPTLLAEHLNVALPMTDWTTSSGITPAQSPQSDKTETRTETVKVDATHVWHPRNTEYEIFRVGQTSHTLGALVILNHRTRFDLPTFPLRAIAEKARAEGAILDLEKHNWPWSVLLPPLLKVDLVELANNHHWQTEFGVRNWAIPGGAWMKLPDKGTGIDTELGWTLYGFQNYYAFLNCGLRMWPAAGTANGVHPVPLGFSRVYVHLDGPFDFQAWMRGLGSGRSFVTTGPMLTATLDNKLPGEIFRWSKGSARTFQLGGNIRSAHELDRIEVVQDGRVIQSIVPKNNPLPVGGYITELGGSITPAHTGWVALRCFEKRENNRFRFAHTSPWHFEIDGAPRVLVRAELEWLIQRGSEEIARSEKLLPESGRAEYQSALQFYKDLLKDAP